jgi:Holliday junction resolvase RusA-like endonuclease
MNRLLINAIFPGEPVAWERVMLRGPYMIKPKATRQAQTRLRRQLKCVAPTLRPNDRARFGVQLVFRTARGRKDGDNCEKLVLDAFIKKIWQDDSQIDECQWRMIRNALEPSSTHMIVYQIE